MTSPAEMKMERVVRICNVRGLHARAAAKFVQLVESGAAVVTVSKDGMSVTGTSIMGLMALSASLNTEIRISTSGADAAGMLEALARLVENRFGEDI